MARSENIFWVYRNPIFFLISLCILYYLFYLPSEYTIFFTHFPTYYFKVPKITPSYILDDNIEVAGVQNSDLSTVFSIRDTFLDSPSIQKTSTSFPALVSDEFCSSTDEFFSPWVNVTYLDPFRFSQYHDFLSVNTRDLKKVHTSDKSATIQTLSLPMKHHVNHLVGIMDLPVPTHSELSRISASTFPIIAPPHWTPSSGMNLASSTKHLVHHSLNPTTTTFTTLIDTGKSTSKGSKEKLTSTGKKSLSNSSHDKTSNVVLSTMALPPQHKVGSAKDVHHSPLPAFPLPVQHRYSHGALSYGRMPQCRHSGQPGRANPFPLSVRSRMMSSTNSNSNTKSNTKSKSESDSESDSNSIKNNFSPVFPPNLFDLFRHSQALGKDTVGKDTVSLSREVSVSHYSSSNAHISRDFSTTSVDHDSSLITPSTHTEFTDSDANTPQSESHEFESNFDTLSTTVKPSKSSFAPDQWIGIDGHMYGDGTPYCNLTAPIDAVYIWVNGTVNRQRVMKDEYQRRNYGEGAMATATTDWTDDDYTMDINTCYGSNARNYMLHNGMLDMIGLQRDIERKVCRNVYSSLYNYWFQCNSRHSGRKGAADELDNFVSNPTARSLFTSEYLRYIKNNHKHLLTWGLDRSVSQAVTDEDEDANRYRDNNELKYSIRSLFMFAPWTRRIYLVTNGQIPIWLNLTHPAIRIISHEQLSSYSEFLPTFSSPTIENMLHRIPDIAPYYMNFNDDFFLNSHVQCENIHHVDKGISEQFVSQRVRCSIGCDSIMLGDGVCDDMCMNELCHWDFGDCFMNKNQLLDSTNPPHTDVFYSGPSTLPRTHTLPRNKHVKLRESRPSQVLLPVSQYLFLAPSARTPLLVTAPQCAVGCVWEWIGDGVCDSACNTYACGYDGGDCGVRSHTLPSLDLASALVSNSTHSSSLTVFFQPFINSLSPSSLFSSLLPHLSPSRREIIPLSAVPLVLRLDMSYLFSPQAREREGVKIVPVNEYHSELSSLLTPIIRRRITKTRRIKNTKFTFVESGKKWFKTGLPLVYSSHPTTSRLYSDSPPHALSDSQVTELSTGKNDNVSLEDKDKNKDVESESEVEVETEDDSEEDEEDDDFSESSPHTLSHILSTVAAESLPKFTPCNSGSLTCIDSVTAPHSLVYLSAADHVATLFLHTRNTQENTVLPLTITTLQRLSRKEVLLTQLRERKSAHLRERKSVDDPEYEDDELDRETLSRILSEGVGNFDWYAVTHNLNITLSPANINLPASTFSSFAKTEEDDDIDESTDSTQTDSDTAVDSVSEPSSSPSTSTSTSRSSNLSKSRLPPPSLPPNVRKYIDARTASFASALHAVDHITSATQAWGRDVAFMDPTFIQSELTLSPSSHVDLSLGVNSTSLAASTAFRISGLSNLLSKGLPYAPNPLSTPWPSTLTQHLDVFTRFTHDIHTNHWKHEYHAGSLTNSLDKGIYPKTPSAYLGVVCLECHNIKPGSVFGTFVRNVFSTSPNLDYSTEEGVEETTTSAAWRDTPPLTVAQMYSDYSVLDSLRKFGLQTINSDSKSSKSSKSPADFSGDHLTSDNHPDVAPLIPVVVYVESVPKPTPLEREESSDTATTEAVDVTNNSVDSKRSDSDPSLSSTLDKSTNSTHFSTGFSNNTVNPQNTSVETTETTVSSNISIDSNSINTNSTDSSTDNYSSSSSTLEPFPHRQVFFLSDRMDLPFPHLVTKQKERLSKEIKLILKVATKLHSMVHTDNFWFYVSPQQYVKTNNTNIDEFNKWVQNMHNTHQSLSSFEDTASLSSAVLLLKHAKERVLETALPSSVTPKRSVQAHHKQSLNNTSIKGDVLGDVNNLDHYLLQYEYAQLLAPTLPLQALQSSIHRTMTVALNKYVCPSLHSSSTSPSTSSSASTSSSPLPPHCEAASQLPFSLSLSPLINASPYPSPSAADYLRLHPHAFIELQSFPNSQNNLKHSHISPYHSLFTAYSHIDPQTITNYYVARAVGKQAMLALAKPRFLDSMRNALTSKPLANTNADRGVWSGLLPKTRVLDINNPHYSLNRDNKVLMPYRPMETNWDPLIYNHLNQQLIDIDTVSSTSSTSETDSNSHSNSISHSGSHFKTMSNRGSESISKSDSDSESDKQSYDLVDGDVDRVIPDRPKRLASVKVDTTLPKTPSKTNPSLSSSLLTSFPPVTPGFSNHPTYVKVEDGFIHHGRASANPVLDSYWTSAGTLYFATRNPTPALINKHVMSVMNVANSYSFNNKATFHAMETSMRRFRSNKDLHYYIPNLGHMQHSTTELDAVEAWSKCDTDCNDYIDASEFARCIGGIDPSAISRMIQITDGLKTEETERTKGKMSFTQKINSNSLKSSPLDSVEVGDLISSLWTHLLSEYSTVYLHNPAVMDRLLLVLSGIQDTGFCQYNTVIHQERDKQITAPLHPFASFTQNGRRITLAEPFCHDFTQAHLYARNYLGERSRINDLNYPDLEQKILKEHTTSVNNRNFPTSNNDKSAEGSNRNHLKYLKETEEVLVPIAPNQLPFFVRMNMPVSISILSQSPLMQAIVSAMNVSPYTGSGSGLDEDINLRKTPNAYYGDNVYANTYNNTDISTSVPLTDKSISFNEMVLLSATSYASSFQTFTSPLLHKFVIFDNDHLKNMVRLNDLWLNRYPLVCVNDDMDDDSYLTQGHALLMSYFDHLMGEVCPLELPSKSVNMHVHMYDRWEYLRKKEIFQRNGGVC